MVMKVPIRTRLLWGTDIDDVQYPTREDFIQFCQAQKGSTASLQDLRRYHIEQALGISYQELKCWFEEYYTTPMFRALRPYDDAQRIMQLLLERGEGIVTTARPDHLRHKTYEALERDFGSRVFAGVYFTNDHDNNPGAQTKVELCQELGVTLFLEDNLRIALECAGAGIEVFLMDQPWNQTDQELPGNIHRVKSLTHAYESMNGRH